MANVYTTGPVLIYSDILTRTAGAPAAIGTPAFFGTGQQPPDIHIQHSFDQVMNDLAGTKLPFDRLDEGEEAQTSVVINRYNEGMLNAMMARPRPNLSIAGQSGSGEIGTLMNAEGCTFCMWFYFPYAPKAFQQLAGNAAVPGYRFPFSFLMGPEQIKGGTKDKQINLTWQHQRGFFVPGGTLTSPVPVTGPSNLPGLAVGAFLLYDILPASFASLPPIN